MGQCKKKKKEGGLCSTCVRVAWSREMTAQTHTHRLPCSLPACLPCLRSKLARREHRGLDADGEVVPFPLAPYFVAMSVGTNHRAVFMVELHTHTADPIEGNVTC